MRLAPSFGIAAMFVLSACGSRSSSGANGAGGTGATSSGGAETGGAGRNPATGGAGGNPATGGAGGSSAGGGAGTNSGGGDAGGEAPGCGNGVVEAGEVCDDGGSTAGDGCSATCAVETGFVCTDSPSVCTHPSCAGLAKTCGPNGNGDCCASPVVTGITSATFYRSYDGVTPGYTSKAAPAQVSDFRLDAYEITVGRFRKFVAAYSQTMIAEGAGANPNNPSDTGWSTAWNTNLAANATTLAAALRCGPPYQTWTDDVGSRAAESLHINCLDWYEAEAFCIWDGGRLPTEAEWNYAASGGTEQRVHPWGSEAPDCTYANYYGRAGGTDNCVLPGTGATNAVGSESPKGDGRFGQADLAGNVWEWVQDWHASPYTKPCNDCADLTAGSHRGVRGGGFFDSASLQLSSFRSNDAPSDHDISIGARCARTR
jgi:sulfatase modifying factor 1